MKHILLFFYRDKIQNNFQSVHACGSSQQKCNPMRCYRSYMIHSSDDEEWYVNAMIVNDDIMTMKSDDLDKEDR